MLRYTSCAVNMLYARGALRVLSGEESLMSHKLLIITAPLLSARCVRMASTGAPGAAESLDNSNVGSGSNMQCREASIRRLAVVRPDLVGEWVPELNDSDVSSVLCTSTIDAWWRCNACGANYRATVKDRATIEKGCPECASTRTLRQNHVSSDSCTGTAAVSERTNETAKGSLKETHPAIADRWDYERNGLLLPTDVDAASELNVWWKPAPGRPSRERSFRRPVFAFVETPYSEEEQLEAQTALELDVLQQVRQASKITTARENHALPAAARMLDDIVFRNNSSSSSEHTSATTNIAASSEPMITEGAQGNRCNLDGEDLYKAVELWERKHKTKAGLETRPMFYSTENCDGAAIARGQVLTAYHRFVSDRKPKVCTAHDGNENDQLPIPSAIEDPDWLQHFTLRVDDVAIGHSASSARLVLPDNVAFVSAVDHEKHTTVASNGASRKSRMATLPPPPEEYGSEVRTTFAVQKRSYPRRPPQPPAREDDVTEAVPKATEAAGERAIGSFPHHTGSGAARNNGLPEASFAVVSLSGAQSLAREYNSGTTDNIDALFDAKGEELQRQTLLGPTAISSMTEDQVRALQYNRGSPRPRRTGRFRLRPPVETDSGSTEVVRKGDVLTSTFGSGVLSATDPPTQDEDKDLKIIQAPGAPRKVSRPKRKKAEEAAPGDDYGNNAVGAAAGDASKDKVAAPA